MAWKFVGTKEFYEGPTHSLMGVTYSGATRTPDSRRLFEVADPKPQSSSKQKQGAVKKTRLERFHEA